MVLEFDEFIYKILLSFQTHFVTTRTPKHSRYEMLPRHHVNVKPMQRRPLRFQVTVFMVTLQVPIV